MNDDARGVLTLILLGLLLAVLGIGGCAYIRPRYRVWQQGMEGEAELKRAEQNRRIEILEAEARRDAAMALAAAEVERAKGVAQANAIIGESLQGNEAYLRYLWIQGVQDSDTQRIYIPTEAGIPILEVGK